MFKMRKLRSLIATMCLIAIPNLSTAQSIEESIIGQLQAQGFTRIEVSRTLLGRVHLKATSATLEREMVFNPVSGEILRDYWEDREDNGASAPRVLDPTRGRNDNDSDNNDARATSSGSGSGNGRSEDRGNSGSGNQNDNRGRSDDRRSDDNRSDNSGRGNSNNDRGRNSSDDDD